MLRSKKLEMDCHRLTEAEFQRHLLRHRGNDELPHEHREVADLIVPLSPLNRELLEVLPYSLGAPDFAATCWIDEISLVYQGALPNCFVATAVFFFSAALSLVSIPTTMYCRSPGKTK